MFLSTKLNNDLLQFIAEVNQKGKSRSTLTAIAVAKSIALNLNVPNTPVEDFKNFYNVNYKTSAYSLISKINEILIVDIEFDIFSIVVLNNGLLD